MAPSIAEPVSLRALPKSILKTDAGHNKENLIGYGEAYKHADEIKGTTKQPPAAFPDYLPVWDNETERLAQRIRTMDPCNGV
jgi:sulfonate dioxygenase